MPKKCLDVPLEVTTLPFYCNITPKFGDDLLIISMLYLKEKDIWQKVEVTFQENKFFEKKILCKKVPTLVFQGSR